MNELARTIRDRLPKELGFILVTHPFNQDVVAGGNYISDMTPDSGIDVMRGTADRLEAKLRRNQ